MTSNRTFGWYRAPPSDLRGPPDQLGVTPSRIEATAINGIVVSTDTFTPALNDWQEEFRDDVEELQERLAAITQAMPKPVVRPPK